MGKVILWLAEEVLPQQTYVDWDKIQKVLAQLLDAVAGMVKNPILSIVAIGSVGLVSGAIIWWLKKQADALARQRAKEDTDAGYQEQIDTRIPQNEKDNEKDNANRNKLDDLN